MHQKLLQGPADGPTEFNKPSLEHFYVLKPPVLAHKNAPEAIFGASITEICDSGNFEEKC